MPDDANVSNGNTQHSKSKSNSSAKVIARKTRKQSRQSKQSKQGKQNKQNHKKPKKFGRESFNFWFCVNNSML